MNAQARQRADWRRGFTIVELMVVVALIAVILAVAVPTTSRMMSNSRVEAARGGVASAVATARRYARPDLGGAFPEGDYQGSAVVFTPANEIRITQHHFNTRDPGGNLLVMGTSPLAGYRDIADQPYMAVPRGVGIVGILRMDSNDPVLVTPPFAVRFNRSGVLMPARRTSDHAVIYDGDYDGWYDPADGRYDGYDVDEYDPERAGRQAGVNWHADEEAWMLPFERFECVIGIIAYDKAALRNAGENLVTEDFGGDWYLLNASARDWILANGRPVFFNRYTGSGIKP